MGRHAVCILLLFMLLAACSSPAPTWRSRVAPMLDDLDRQGALIYYPQEYRSLQETFEHGDAVLHVQSNHAEADIYYQLAYQKADLLRSELHALKLKIAEEERQRVLHQAALEEEARLMREAVEAEQRLREQETLKIQPAEKIPVSPQKKTILKDPPQNLLSTYTVRRGETLPQIAGRTDVYNDSSLWPIIYRANRDQIRDPKHLWPGQVLTVPRHFSREDAIEAKRFSGKK